MKLNKLSERFNTEFRDRIGDASHAVIKAWLKLQPEDKMAKFYIDQRVIISPLKRSSVKLIREYLNDVIEDIDQGFANNQLDNLPSFNRETNKRKLEVLVEDFLLFLKIKYPESDN